MKKSAKDRLLSKTEKTSSCWIWKGAVTGSGYGTIRGIDQRMIMTHRLSFILHYGTIPKNICVLHTCDNKLCVNPDHLFLGTQKDNMHDMIRKGRQATGTALNHPDQTGSKNFGSKVTEDQVRTIRRLHSEGISQYRISMLTDVPKPNVWNIVHRKSWKHI